MRVPSVVTFEDFCEDAAAASNMSTSVLVPSSLILNVFLTLNPSSSATTSSTMLSATDAVSSFSSSLASSPALPTSPCLGGSLPQFSSYAAATFGSRVRPDLSASLPVLTHLPCGGRRRPQVVKTFLQPLYPPCTATTAVNPASWSMSAACWQISPSKSVTRSFAPLGKPCDSTAATNFASGRVPGASATLAVHCGGLVRCSRSYALNGRISSILYPSRSSMTLPSSTVTIGAPAVVVTAPYRRLGREATRPPRRRWSLGAAGARKEAAVTELMSLDDDWSPRRGRGRDGCDLMRLECRRG
mmetsp:Transcript_12506/g.57887  ORF Transcript_12506/g.57887 Transcript_12506/m.57887 type:complete len:301 (+) Transcript_12506:266-1168(+)